jgi:hypothetical protein
MPGRADLTDTNAIDVGKRYDIYVAESPTRMVVFRGAFFRGLKALESEGRYDFRSDFIEIEQPTGEPVFLRRFSIVMFCDAGTRLACESLIPKDNP